MLDLRLYMLQRISALVMAPLTLGHLGVMIYAIQGGLSTAEILARTQGSGFWLVYYGSFVLAVAVHASIGLRVIAFETLAIRGLALNTLTWAIGLVLFAMGMHAVLAVTLS